MKEKMRSLCTRVFCHILFLTISCWFNSKTAASQHPKELVSLIALFSKEKKIKSGSTETNSSQSLLELISFALEISKASHEF